MDKNKFNREHADTPSDQPTADPAHADSAANDDAATPDEPFPLDLDDGDLPDQVTLEHAQLIALKQAILQLQAERDGFRDSMLRGQADFDNYRKRNAKLRQDSYEDGLRDAVSALLPVLDNLDRAAESNTDAPSALLEGVRLVVKQFIDALAKLDVTEIEALGIPFDPERHHAVAQGECRDDEQPGSVQDVFLKGYIHKDRVLRASMVKVSQG